MNVIDKEIFFSVIIPVYNNEKTLENTLLSVINQEYNNYEIIIVDDKSTDKSVKKVEEFCSKYNDKKIYVIESKTKIKAGGARNRGIEVANGEYIIFLDADDLLVGKNAFSKISEKIINNSTPDIVYIGFEYNYYGKMIEKIPNLNDYEKINRINNWITANVWSCVWNKEFLNKKYMKFDENIYYEDFLFYYKGVLFSDKCAVLPEIIYKYQYNPQSVTNSTSQEKIDDMNNQLEKLYELVQKIDDNELKELFMEKAYNSNRNFLNHLINKLKNPIKTYDMLVSLIIPAYNAEDEISTCLNSIVNQTYKNIEIIIVIDGATDGTYKVCKEYMDKDKRVKVINKEKNEGTLMARQDGIKIAQGKYIMFIDSDDYIVDDAVEKLVNIASKRDVDLIRFRYKKIPDNYYQYEYLNGENMIYIEKEEFKEKVYPMFIEGYMLNALFTNFVKKEKIESCMFNIKLTFGEDFLTNLQLFTNINNVMLYNEPLYFYVSNPKSITKSRKVQKLFRNMSESILVYSKLYDYVKIWGMQDIVSEERIKNRILKEVKSFIKILELDNKSMER